MLIMKKLFNLSFYQKQIFCILSSLNLLQRKTIILLIDIVLLVFSMYLSRWLVFDRLQLNNISNFTNLLLISIFIVSILYPSTGQYKSLTRYIGSIEIYKLLARNVLVVLALAFISNIVFNKLLSLRFWFALWIILSALNGTIRFILRDILLYYFSQSKENKLIRVAIYGAGRSGAQLAASLRLTSKYIVEAFLDDDPSLWQRSLYGIKIYPFKSFKKIRGRIEQVYLAIPSLSNKNKGLIFEQVRKSGVDIYEMPSIDDLTNGRVKIDSLKPIEVEDLLGRNSVNTNPYLVESVISRKVVCITGAGGSIGSELSRQVLKLQPTKIILLDISEINLYKIHQELSSYNQYLEIETIIKPVLGNAADGNFVKELFTNENINVVFHAAAYKHVPLVEANPVQGISNNLLSTKAICEAAREAKLQKAIFISTDKAVRPTNIMGASKRLAELIVHQYAKEEGYSQHQSNISSTSYSLVRFGNVLGSSGSVVPKFKSQIANGGPITVTHEEVIRYFMTISEAVELVLQAAVMSTGGEIFLLEMGEPVKIIDLAKQMISLSGLTIKNEANPQGDIEIIKTGLRPGEKLYEELLINGESLPTKHPLIFKAIESYSEDLDLWSKVKELEALLKSNDLENSLRILAEIVPDWKSKQNIL